MKLVVLILCLGFFSALLAARDLQSLAKKERARRAAIRPGARPSRSFTDADLEAYKTARRDEPQPRRPNPRPNPPRRAERDFAKERAYWQRQKLENDRDLARLDARIRKLVWRLREHRAKRRECGGCEWVMRYQPRVRM